MVRVIWTNKTEFMVLSRDIHDTKSNTLNFGQSLLFKVNTECQDQRKRFLGIENLFRKESYFCNRSAELVIKSQYEYWLLSCCESKKLNWFHTDPGSILEPVTGDEMMNMEHWLEWMWEWWQISCGNSMNSHICRAQS